MFPLSGTSVVYFECETQNCVFANKIPTACQRSFVFLITRAHEDRAAISRGKTRLALCVIDVYDNCV